MVPHLRQEQIMKYFDGKDVVFMKELADALGISLSTIRRDIQILEKDGLLVTMRGGAVRANRDDYDAPVTTKKMVNIQAKEVIAQKAAALVQEGDHIYIDSGTTTVMMMKYLAGKKITVVTSSTQLLEHIPVKNVSCILLGGEVQEDRQSVIGTLTEKMIQTMYFDKAFIGANGYVPDEGIYTYDPREARKKEIVKENSQEVYMLLDTSKKGKRAFSKVCDFDECILITELQE